ICTVLHPGSERPSATHERHPLTTCDSVVASARSPRLPFCRAFATAPHVSPVMPALGPDRAVGHFPVRIWCRTTHLRMLAHRATSPVLAQSAQRLGQALRRAPLRAFDPPSADAVVRGQFQLHEPADGLAGVQTRTDPAPPAESV